MNHEQLIADAKEATMSPWQKHRFLMLVGGTIMVALALVVVALVLYNSSGAAQLDLSRPGYVSVREQVDNANDFKSFSSTGEINETVLNEFRALYTDQAEKAVTVDSFGGHVMSDESLSLDAPQ